METPAKNNVMRAMLTTAAFIIVCASPAGAQLSAPAPDFVRLLGTNLHGWVVEHEGESRASVSDRVLTITPNAGMVRTEEEFGLFGLRFDVQALDKNAEATLALFGWKGSKDAPYSALGVPLLHAVLGRTEKVDFTSVKLDAATFTAAKSIDEWQSYEVVRSDYSLSVRLNGKEIGQQYVSPAHKGWIGVQATRGNVAIRDVRIMALPKGTAGQPAQDFPGAYRPGKGVTTPRLRRDVRPQYTSDAMRAKVQGSAMVECVVQTDGTVGDARIIRSLDAHHGLDAEALKAAKQWLFIPGTQDGVPVPVVVTIQLTFTLGK